MRLEPRRDGEEHTATLDAVRTAAQRLALAHAGDRPLGEGADAERADAGEGNRGVGPEDTVAAEAHVALELRQRPRSVGAEMPSSLPASKPSVLRRRWSSTTSSPRSIGRRT